MRRPHFSDSAGMIAAGLAVSLVAVWLVGCTSTVPPVRPAPQPKSASQAQLLNVSVPAGVDSAVAVAATIAARQVVVGFKEDSLAQQLYAEGMQRREEGQPLKEAFLKHKAAPQPVAPQDSTRSLELSKQADDAALKGDKALGNKRVKDFSLEDLAKYPEAARQKAAEYYEEARDLFEQALQLNPWDAVTYDALDATYADLIDLQSSLSAVDAEIAARHKYMDLHGERFSGFMRLAKLYSEKGDTVQALISCRRAEDALLIWAPLTPADSTDFAPTSLSAKDYSNWLRAIQYQCHLEVALGLSAPALSDLHRLKSTCRPGVDSLVAAYAESQLDWLSWDNGNLAASKLWLNFDTRRRAGAWDDARKIIADLLPMLTNPEASFQMERWAATIDFASLGQYEAGLSRMRRLLTERGFGEVNANLDSLLSTNGQDGFAERMVTQRKATPPQIVDLLDDYGAGCLSYGERVENQEKNRERAYIYYYQAAVIPCKRQGQALSYLADLSRNQPDRAILYGETALTPGLDSTLDPISRGNLFQTLREAYRRKNDRAHTEYYFQALEAARKVETKP